MRTAVVAGATGYLGGHVVEALHAAGWRVRALARDAARLGRVRSACDEVFLGEATRPETLAGLFDGATLAFSSIGIRHVKRRPTIWDVDCQANLNLVEAAKSAGVGTFAFTSVFRGDQLRGELEVAEARERVVDALRASGMGFVVLRPTGFFNDMHEFFEMARGGRVWLPGDGGARINPIHGRDIGDELARQLARGTREATLPLGGPDTFTLREIGELAFATLGKPARFGRIPVGLVRALATAIKPFNPNAATIARGLVAMTTHDGVAPAVGTHRLRDEFEALARRSEPAAATTVPREGSLR